MVREHSSRVLGSRTAMHKSCGTECGLTGITKVCEPGSPFAKRKCVSGGQLHEEIVGMLCVDYWLTVVGLTRLEQQRRASGRKGKRFETEHGSQLKRAAAELMKRHRHEPVLRLQLRHTARTALRINTDDRVVVKHQQPVTGLLVMHVHRR